MADRDSRSIATATPLSPSLIQRVSSGVRYMVSGVTPTEWMGPGQPLAPQAQDVQGRQFDYPVGSNIQTQPRSGDDRGISFRDLRELADSYDLLRLVIETRKDQVAHYDWNVKPRQKAGQSSSEITDPRIEKIENFFAFPDGENDFSSWLRMLLEDMLVIDAACLYRRKTRGGEPYSFDVIDGATIKRLIDERGRTPIAPSPAYQQVLKGIPAVDYTTDDLLYIPRNIRSNRIYGMSQVEQVVMTVNIGLRKQLSTLNYFTEGNTPEALVGMPETWTADEIRAWQEYWDNLLAGNLGARRHTKFVPGGLKYQATREPHLKDEFDDWLARVICFAFSIPPTAFTKQMNRATAETAKESAEEEGLAPTLSWVKRFMDRIIAQDFEAPDLEFCWNRDRAQNPLEQAQVDKILVSSGIITINEARGSRGMDPLPDGDEAIIETSTGGILLKDLVNPPAPVPTTVAPLAPGNSPDEEKPVEIHDR
jgi:HK97 family phage portal protein